MKTKLTLIIIITLIIVVACHPSKKSTTSSTESTPVISTTPTVAATPSVLATIKPSNGIYEPGNEELVALKTSYNDVTLEKLKEGYVLYAKSACISCHEAQNIYVYDDMKWRFIIDNMAIKARLTPDQKDAVHKYVLSIKATKPK